MKRLIELTGMRAHSGRRGEVTINDGIETLRAELERFGESNDSAVDDRAMRMFNASPESS
jgi:hypothetical protein